MRTTDRYSNLTHVLGAEHPLCAFSHSAAVTKAATPAAPVIDGRRGRRFARTGTAPAGAVSCWSADCPDSRGTGSGIRCTGPSGAGMEKE